MTLEDFVDTPQVVVSPGGAARGDIDDTLTSVGRERRIAITAPNFLSLPLIVETAELVGVFPESLALRFSGLAPLTVFELPIAVEPVTCSLLALAPLARQAEMMWLLDRLLACPE